MLVAIGISCNGVNANVLQVLKFVQNYIIILLLLDNWARELEVWCPHFRVLTYLGEVVHLTCCNPKDK